MNRIHDSPFLLRQGEPGTSHYIVYKTIQLRDRPLICMFFSICVKSKYSLTHPLTPLFVYLRENNTYTFGH